MQCKVCGKELIEEVRPGRKRKYCSKECAYKWQKENPGPGKLKNITKKVCSCCGKEFTVFASGKNRKYCSVKCRGISDRTLKGTNRTCVICGKSYEPIHKKQKCCSRDCQTKATNQALVEGLFNIKKTCTVCGSQFTPIRVNQEFCSKACREKNYNTLNPDYGSAKRGRYRARLANAEHKPYSATEIFQRDGWRCGICGGKVNKKKKYPDPLSASIDHIIPLSRGGCDTEDNVQLSHLKCNVSKSNSQFIPNIIGQLMIV